ncbi:uncharacterized protein LOC113746615 [Larimichthys crocea]|uniref:uncharacterized protein LOC113746615 n=1 Tax=Larimichthys crocea TaxID=215358 RepID=UPI000F5F3158|nr:uncharacterized protein LOC113746615 [Larimichthys crocea]
MVCLVVGVLLQGQEYLFLHSSQKFQQQTWRCPQDLRLIARDPEKVTDHLRLIKFVSPPPQFIRDGRTLSVDQEAVTSRSNELRLTENILNSGRQVASAQPSAASGPLHDIKPGDFVVVKNFRRKSWRHHPSPPGRSHRCEGCRTCYLDLRNTLQKSSTPWGYNHSDSRRIISDVLVTSHCRLGIQTCQGHTYIHIGQKKLTSNPENGKTTPMASIQTSRLLWHQSNCEHNDTVNLSFHRSHSVVGKEKC